MTNLDQTTITLTEEQWERLEAIMDKPMSERPALQRLLNKKSPWEQSQEVVQQNNTEVNP